MGTGWQGGHLRALADSAIEGTRAIEAESPPATPRPGNAAT